MRVLITGGAGYIGSHIVAELVAQGDEVVILDNFSNVGRDALARINSVAGRPVMCHATDLRDENALCAVFRQHAFDAVIHCAGLKSVSESCKAPLSYYDNNVVGTLRLCEVMSRFNVRRLVFSSTAAVYGKPVSNPVTEDMAPMPISPYGQTKKAIEEMLQALCQADDRWRVVLLRYFNPVGAHDSGLIGEAPAGIPENLMPAIVQTAAGLRPYLTVYGNDYPTADGTGIRDYLHVSDLAMGHIKALDRTACPSGCETYNLGSGKGYSVMELIRAFEAVNGVTVPYRVLDRRPGDMPALYADPQKANRELGWRAERTLEAMCASAWKWSLNHMEK